MLKQTVLNAFHRQMGARMVDFGGWDMPVNYGSQIDEHQQVRNHCGLFDVSHMTIVEVCGDDAKAYLLRLLANSVERLSTGKALYSAMLNTKGGVIDDLIVYFRAENRYRLVVNCATRDKDLAWMQAQAEGFHVDIEENVSLAIVAVQGPKATNILQTYIDQAPAALNLSDVRLADIPAFGFSEAGEWLLARTGYTGEDGFECLIPVEEAEDFCRSMVSHGAEMVGLGARDTLRLEAGMNLYGQDMSEDISPLQANMAWTIYWQPEDRQFIGRQALEAERDAGVSSKLVGIILDGRGVLRTGQVVKTSWGDGIVTSGTFSPSLQKSIGMARVPVDALDDCSVMIRNKELAARLVKPQFVRNGIAVVSNL